MSFHSWCLVCFLRCSRPHFALPSLGRFRPSTVPWHLRVAYVPKLQPCFCVPRFAAAFFADSSCCSFAMERVEIAWSFLFQRSVTSHLRKPKATSSHCCNHSSRAWRGK